ncbi:erythromycin esterase family protein [Streptomyces sp. NPDC059477]|uniref:erythromycin esterase family protein n=1 Tax=Streptomyces sp. NPDC059477 TaxID=3346847 RepID=UPI0036798D44
MPESVTRWIGQHAHRLSSAGPEGPLTDLRPLADVVCDAEVVALGAATRQSRELSVLAHRMLRFLVEELGFRTLALEGDDASRVGLDTYIGTGAGDPRPMLAGARSFWRTEEMLDVVHWMRSFNRRHPDDPVRFAETVRAPRGRVPPSVTLAEIEWSLAEDTIRWQERTADRIVYWGGLGHTADSRPRTGSPSSPPVPHRTAGSHLREHFGAGYVSIGLTFHHGTLPYAVPAPPADFADTVLGTAGPGSYLLDLRAEAPATVRTWLDTPTRTRLIGPFYDAADDSAFHLAGGSLTDWFDAVVHTQEVTAARSLSRPNDS